MRFDTNSRKQLEEGTYKVTVTDYPQVIQKGGFDMVEFTFSIEGEEKTFTKAYFYNQLTSLFKALGFEEVEEGVFEGEIQDAYGKKFFADLSFESYTKRDGTEGKARRLSNFRPCEDSELDSIKPEDIVWDE